MKKSEIVVGGHYVAKVSNRLVTVRVDAIRPTSTIRAGKWADTFAYDVTNLATGRKTTFRSAAKFRSFVPNTGTGGYYRQLGQLYSMQKLAERLA